MFTIFGAGGFIGSHLARRLRAGGAKVQCPDRGSERDLSAGSGSLGHAIYAIGLTGDFRSRPFDAVEAHVSLLSDVLRQARYESFLYLSSTRVYAGLPGPVDEDTPLSITPSGDRLYDLSKLTGEALVLAEDRPAARVARLSNVTGPGQSRATFLGAITTELLETGHVTIGEAPESCKDYIDVDDVAALLTAIAERGAERLYAVASGRQTTHQEIARQLSSYGAIEFAHAAPTRRFPAISRNRIENEFDFRPRTISESLAGLATFWRGSEETMHG